MPFDGYPELPPAKRTELLSKDFTRGVNSAKADEIALYLHDEDVAAKAVRVSGKRFDEFASRFVKYSYDELIESDEGDFWTKGVYTGIVTQRAVIGCAYSLVKTALQERIPPPQQSDLINKRNRAISYIKSISESLGRVNDLKRIEEFLELDTFESFMKKIEEQAKECIKRNTKEVLSEDRLSRLLTEVKGKATDAYLSVHGESLEEKLNNLDISLNKRLTPLLLQDAKNNNAAAKWEKGMEYIQDLSEQNKRYLSEQD